MLRPWQLKKNKIEEEKKTSSIRNKSAISKLHATVQTDQTSDNCDNIAEEEGSYPL